MAFDVKGAVATLVSQIKAAAQDDHEAVLLLSLTVGAVQSAWGEMANEVEEQKCLMVLEQRAVAPGGKTVEEQKAQAAARLKKRIGDPVSAAEVLQASVLLDSKP